MFQSNAAALEEWRSLGSMAAMRNVWVIEGTLLFVV